MLSLSDKTLKLVCYWLVAWLSGITSVLRRPTSLLHSTCSRWVTTRVGKLSAISQKPCHLSFSTLRSR